jgi:hypothetical protein
VTVGSRCQRRGRAMSGAAGSAPSWAWASACWRSRRA